MKIKIFSLLRTPRSKCIGLLHIYKKKAKTPNLPLKQQNQIQEIQKDIQKNREGDDYIPFNL